MAKPSKNDHFPLALQHLLQAAEDKLSRAGFRLTTPRREILRVLLESSRPLKTAEIYDLVRLRTKIDRVSAYRVLEVFKKLGLIHGVGDSGFVFCSHLENEQNQDAHLFLVCDECQEVQEIDLPEKLRSSIQTQVIAKARFKSKGPIQISGLCAKCS